MRQYDIIFLSVFLLFCAVTYVGVQNHKNMVNDKMQMIADEEARVERQAAIRAQQIKDEVMERLKYKDNVIHDGNQETQTYPISLEATGSYDEENDKITYTWSQLSGKTVELSSTSEKIIYFLADAGDYEFELTVEDIYGATGVETKIVEIQAEPNVAPVAMINIIRKEKPKPKPAPKTPWDGNKDSIKVFQGENGLKQDGIWGKESQLKYKEMHKK